MPYIGWRFPPLSGGNKQGYTNSGIETFKGEELIDNLAREICQNSLDAKQANSNSPVIVKFDLIEFDKNEFDVFLQYKNCLAGCRSYWSDNADSRLSKFLTGAEQTFSMSSIPVLVARDYNTIGLSGSHLIESINTPWSALTGADGVCVKQGDTSGGSYGIGKNAPFACSALSMVFYNTFAVDGHKAFKGVARLATIFNELGQPTQGIGHYQSNDDAQSVWKPIFPGDECSFRNEFEREEYGTDVIVVGFTERDKWKQQVEKAVLKNFFIAILENKLIVTIGDEQLDSSNISNLLNEKYAADPQLSLTAQLFSAYTNPDEKKMISVLEKNDAEIYVRVDAKYKRTIANFRTSGMLVGLNRKRIFQHYAAVLIIRGQKLDSLLRETEPAKHNKWDAKLIDKSEPAKRKEARDVISHLENEVLSLLRSQYENITETTIDSDTADYIADMNDDFGESVQGDDLMRVNQTISGIREKRQRQGASEATGDKDKGKAKKGASPAPPNPGPHPTPPPPKPPIVPPIDVGGGDIDGTAKKTGERLLVEINTSIQKIIPRNTDLGIYEFIVQSEKDCSNIFIVFESVGEDEKSEPIKVEYYMNGKEKKYGANNEIGPLSLKAGTLVKMPVCFTSRERMLINPIITEEKYAKK